MFTSIFNSTEMVSYAAQEIWICTAVSVLLGLFLAWIFHMQGGCSKGFQISLMVLPVVVQAVIMMVNGNLGTSVAVLGAFSLVRFRSMPGGSKEICGVFLAMAVGLATAMGCIGFACLIAVMAGVLMFAASKMLDLVSADEKILRITIPESLDYTTIFDEIFAAYTRKVQLEQVKTTNMGSMFELSYRIRVRNGMNEKEMLDCIRTKNGNLTVICSREIQTLTL